MGKDFWLMYQSSTAFGLQRKLLIVSHVDTTVTVSFPKTNYQETHQVIANEQLVLDITQVTEIPDPNYANTPSIVEEVGVNVSSQDDIALYMLNYTKYNTDGSIVFPTKALGVEYMLVDRERFQTQRGGVGIVTTEDNTTVRIETSQRIEFESWFNYYNRGETYQTVLNRGQAIELGTDNHPVVNDERLALTGTRIVADKPIAVFSADDSEYFPNFNNHSYLIEQLIPLSTHGTGFMALSLEPTPFGETYGFYASENNTRITVNGSHIAILNAGEKHHMILDGANFIESNKPIQVMQYANGSEEGDFSTNALGDPFMLTILPKELFLNDYIFATPLDGFPFNYVNIISKSQSRHAVRIDGMPIDKGRWVSIPNSDYVGANIQVAPGAHFASSVEPIGLYIYGFNDNDSYAYVGGMAVGNHDIVASSVQLDVSNVVP